MRGAPRGVQTVADRRAGIHEEEWRGKAGQLALPTREYLRVNQSFGRDDKTGYIS